MNNSLNLQVKNKLQNTLGLAQRAGKCVTGDDLLNKISKNNVHCVLLANDSSDRTQEQIKKKCEFYDIKVIDVLSKDELSGAIGKYNRVAVGITDRGFSKLMTTYLEEI